MAKFGSTVTTVTIAVSPGGAAKVITPYVDDISPLSIEALTEKTDPFGMVNEEYTPTGKTKVPDIILSGHYDTTADVGSWTVLKQVAGDYAPASVGRELVIVAATGATFTVTVHLVKTEIVAKNGSLCRYQTTLKQKSAGVWS